MIKMLVLGNKEDIKYVQKIVNEVTKYSVILASSNLQECLALARDRNPQIAFVDQRLIASEEFGDICELSRMIPKTFLFPDLSHFSDNIPVQLSLFTCTAPCYLNKVIKDIILGTKKEEDNSVLILKSKTETISVNKRKILFIESFNGKCAIHTRKRVIEVRHSLKKLEPMMGRDFFRVHRAYLVNIGKIKRIRSIYDRSYEIEFYDYDKTALMSRYRQQEFNDYMSQFI